MDVKEAVKAAKDWLVYVMADELPANVGLEEVEFDEPKGDGTLRSGSLGRGIRTRTRYLLGNDF